MASIRQYVAWAERRIGAVVVAEGLQVGLLKVTQGPLTLIFAVRLIRPQPAALRKLLGLGPALAQALQVRSVRVSEGPGAVTIELPLPAEAQRTPTAGELARYTTGLSVAVGLNAMRRPVAVDLRQHGAIFWVGPSRRGKTESMKSSLYALARANPGNRIKYVILSQKRADWAAFEPARDCLGIVQQPAEALEALRWAASVVSWRAESGRITAALIVVADDLLNLLAAEPALAGPLGEISSMGAGLGVHLLAGTQEAGSKRGTGGAGVENNATARILYRVSSAAAGARAAGQGEAGLEALSGAKGDALLLLDGEGTRIATGLSDDRQIAMLPGGAGPLKGAWRQPAATARHQGQPEQPAQPAGAEAYALATVGPRVGGGVQPAAQPGGAQPAAGGVSWETLFPIAKRSPTEAEALAIAELHRAGRSLNALCLLVYGHKDGRGFAWVKEALKRAESATEPAEGAEDGAEGLADAGNGAESLDLNTESGREAVRALLAKANWKETVKALEQRRLS